MKWLSYLLSFLIVTGCTVEVRWSDTNKVKSKHVTKHKIKHKLKPSSTPKPMVPMATPSWTDKYQGF